MRSSFCNVLPIAFICPTRSTPRSKKARSSSPAKRLTPGSRGVRRDGPTVPGMSKIDERNLVDLDERAYQQSKSVIESAFVYFLVNKDNFATEGFAALSRLPDEIRRCLSAASRLGLEIQIEVRGYADAVGNDTQNAGLSQRRAEAVRDFLVKCGFEPSLFKVMGMGAPPKTETPTPEQSDRRVALKVVPRS